MIIDAMQHASYRKILKLGRPLTHHAKLLSLFHSSTRDSETRWAESRSSTNTRLHKFIPARADSEQSVGFTSLDLTKQAMDWGWKVWCNMLLRCSRKRGGPQLSCEECFTRDLRKAEKEENLTENANNRERWKKKYRYQVTRSCTAMCGGTSLTPTTGKHEEERMLIWSLSRSYCCNYGAKWQTT